MKRSPSFRAGLAGLRQSCAAFYGLGADTFHPVILRPTLRWVLAPRPRQRRAEGDGQRTEAHRRRERIAAALGGVGAPPLGLSKDRDPTQPPNPPRQRHGMTGLTDAGAGNVEDLCALTRQDSRLMGLWTVTLPREALAKLDTIPGGVPLFSDTLRRRFSETMARALRRQCRRTNRPRVPLVWAFVIEPQAAGAPHWHFVFRARVRRGMGWVLGKAQLDRLIRNALQTVTGEEWPVQSAGNVQKLRTDPGRYLSKYLRKGNRTTSADAILRGGWTLNSVPLQWWGWSKEAAAMVERYRFPIPSVLVGWLSKQWPLLRGIGALEAKVWQPPAEGAPAMVVGSFRSVAAAEECLSHLAHLATTAVPLGRTFGRT